MKRAYSSTEASVSPASASAAARRRCRGQVARIKRDRLPEKTDRRGPFARFGEGAGALAEDAERTRTVLLLEVHLRESAITALGAGELIDPGT